MAEVNTAEAEAKADAAFGAGFGVTPPAEVPPAMVVDEPVAEPAKPDAIAVPVVVPEKPQYIRLTKQEWDNAKASVLKVSSLESQVAKLTGSMPKAEQIAQQVIDNVRSQTPAGLTVEFSDEDFADLADFPELQTATRAIIERAFKKANLKGTGTEASPAQPVDVNKAVQEALSNREADALAEAYPDWSDIVGRPPTADAPISGDNPFRAWLATQSAEYQQKVGQTNSPAVVQAAIDKFTASQSTSASPSSKPDKAAARRAVIEDAVTPRGESPPPLNAPQTAEEAFGKAFKAVKSH